MVETRKKITGVVAFLVFCAALFSIARTCRDTSDRQLADAETALRRVGAEETVNLLGENSRVVFLTIKDVGGKQRESLEQLRLFLRQLFAMLFGNQLGCSISALRPVTITYRE